MTQSVLTFLLEALALGGAGWLTTEFTIGLVSLWKRCDPEVVSKAVAPNPIPPESSAAEAPAQSPVALPELSNQRLPKLGSEQPVDPDPDFDIELEDAGAIASFDDRFA